MNSKKLRIVLNDDIYLVKDIKEKLLENGGYCPCKLIKSTDTKCICKEFREQTTPGFCHCGLYKKVWVISKEDN